MSDLNVLEIPREEVSELPMSKQIEWCQAKFDEMLSRMKAKMPNILPTAALGAQTEGLPEVDQLSVPSHIHDTVGVSSWSYSNPQFSSQQL